MAVDKTWLVECGELDVVKMRCECGVVLTSVEGDDVECECGMAYDSRGAELEQNNQ